MRTRWLFIIAIVVSLLFNGQTLVPASAQDTGANVPMFRGNPAHTGEMPGPGPSGDMDNPPIEAWRFDSPSEVSSTPAVVNEVVYVGSFDHNIYALDAISGSEHWRFAAGGEIYSSPSVSDGMVYVGSGDYNVYALDATTGTKRWTFTTQGEVDSSPTVVNGLVYVGSSDDNLYALDAASGKERWHFTTEGSIYASSAVIDGVVYVGSVDGNLYAVDAVSGAERWRFAIGYPVTSSPAVVGGVVYAGSYDNNLHAVDAVSGAERWRFATGGDVTSSPAVIDGVVYVGSDDGNLYAIGLSPSVAATATAQVISAAATATAQVISADATDAAVQATQVSFQATAQALMVFPNALASNAAAGADLPAGFANPSVVQGKDAGTVWFPAGDAVSSLVQVGLSAGQGAGGLIVFSVYGSDDEANAAFASVPMALERAGWVKREAQGVGHDALCLVLATDSQSEAVCYVSRDNVVIATESFLSLNAADAVYGNANDLAVWASGIYDQTPKPS